jgi:hypothetical protein
MPSTTDTFKNVFIPSIIALSRPIVPPDEVGFYIDFTVELGGPGFWEIGRLLDERIPEFLKTNGFRDIQSVVYSINPESLRLTRCELSALVELKGAVPASSNAISRKSTCEFPFRYLVNVGNGRTTLAVDYGLLSILSKDVDILYSVEERRFTIASQLLDQFGGEYASDFLKQYVSTNISIRVTGRLLVEQLAVGVGDFSKKADQTKQLADCMQLLREVKVIMECNDPRQDVLKRIGTFLDKPDGT